MSEAVLFPMVDADNPGSEGVVATWFVDDGATVREGLLLAEVQVSKITEELHAPCSGMLRHAIPEGEVVGQGAVVARIE